MHTIVVVSHSPPKRNCFFRRVLSAKPDIWYPVYKTIAGNHSEWDQILLVNMSKYIPGTRYLEGFCACRRSYQVLNMVPRNSGIPITAYMYVSGIFVFSAIFFSPFVIIVLAFFFSLPSL